MIYKFTLKSEARSSGPLFETGFKDGYEATLRSKNPSYIPLDGPYGNEWNAQPLGYSEGYAEGWISGRSKIHSNYYE